MRRFESCRGRPTAEPSLRGLNPAEDAEIVDFLESAIWSVEPLRREMGNHARARGTELQVHSQVATMEELDERPVMRAGGRVGQDEPLECFVPPTTSGSAPEHRHQVVEVGFDDRITDLVHRAGDRRVIRNARRRSYCNCASSVCTARIARTR